MLDEHHLEVIAQPELLATLQALGATGLLLPGVDGDFAALYTFDPGDMPTLTGVLSALTEESGAECVSMTEANSSPGRPRPSDAGPHARRTFECGVTAKRFRGNVSWCSSRRTFPRKRPVGAGLHGARLGWGTRKSGRALEPEAFGIGTHDMKSAEERA